MSELNEIWQENNGKLPEDKLMAYLEGRLTPEAQHEVEQWLAEEGMESDAIDGLKELLPAEARFATDRLNHTLKKQLMPQKRKRRQIKYIGWAVQTVVVIILLLIILAYIVIRLSVKK